MMAMVVFGCGEIIGGLFIGQVIDRIGNKLTSALIIIFVTLQTVLLLLFLYKDTYI